MMNAISTGKRVILNNTITFQRYETENQFSSCCNDSFKSSASSFDSRQEINPAIQRRIKNISVADSAGILAETDRISKIWEYDTGGTIGSSPCIGPDNTVFIESIDHKLYAIKDGQKLWEYNIGNEKSNSIHSSFCAGSDGTVYFGSHDHKLYAIKDGQKLWEYQTGDELCSAPGIGADGTIYAGSLDHKLYAIKDGRKIWEFATGGELCSAPCIGPDGTIYITSGNHTLYAIKDGIKQWEYKAEAEHLFNIAES